MTHQFFTPEPDEAAVQALAQELDIGNSTARAALLLDAAAPGWEENVDLDTLKMSSTTYCILGQQIGSGPFEGCHSFDSVLERLGYAIGDVERVDDGLVYNFSHSGDEYRTLIAARRSAAMRGEAGA